MYAVEQSDRELYSKYKRVSGSLLNTNLRISIRSVSLLDGKKMKLLNENEIKEAEVLCASVQQHLRMLYALPYRLAVQEAKKTSTVPEKTVKLHTVIKIQENVPLGYVAVLKCACGADKPVYEFRRNDDVTVNGNCVYSADAPRTGNCRV